MGVCRGPTVRGREVGGALVGRAPSRAQALAKKGSLREGFWKPAEGERGRSSREAFPLPGERASARLFLASCWSH